MINTPVQNGLNGRQELIREDIRQLRTSHKGKSNEGVIEIEIYGQAC